ncbi:MAG: hypothetical protein E3J26_01380 [Candidatus Zixiibacteriota bacterium]|nr:MAG: hypothetical protein E3J26_01380 [candidate division Zixibacteria bacterium]
MKRLRLIAVFMLVAFAFTCFFSMPVLSTDEWPWDADDEPGSDGSESPGDTNGNDTGFVYFPDYSSGNYDTSFWLLGFMFRSSYHFAIIYLANSQVNSGDRHVRREAANEVTSSGPVK